MAKRILLITDSLGCPRAETPVENTWTEKILRHYTDDNDTHITSDTGGGISIPTVSMVFLQVG